MLFRSGAEQIFLGRLSKLWGAAHGKELAAASVTVHRFNSGSTWVKKVCSVIWDHIHLMWLERNQDRHGREQKEKAERARQRSLREAAARHRHKEGGNLDLGAAGRPIFCSARARHREKESSAREAGMWLSACRPALVASKARVMEQRQAMRKCSNARGATAPGEGHSSAGSADDGVPAEPIIADPEADLREVIDDSSP